MKYTLPIDQYGELFEEMSASGLWEDDKIIADLLPLEDPTDILRKYLEEKDKKDFDLKDFVDSYFTYHAKHSDFESDPDKPIRQHLKDLWQHLKRSKDEYIEGSSLIPLPHPYIVPGGRFNEIYYWDSYFTMLGLGVSGEIDTIASMIKNFAYLIDEFGYIPNGNRNYFLSRSQPPFFSLMVRLLEKHKGPEVVIRYLPQLMKEYEFWMSGSKQLDKKNNAISRVVLYHGYTLNRYYDNDASPRAEMYATDIKDAKEYDGSPQDYYLHVKAACESGWDFSTRWLRDKIKLSTIHTTEILPVDLNCLLYYLEETIAYGQNLVGDKSLSNRYTSKAKMRAKAINKVFWNPVSQFYEDVDFYKEAHKGVISAAGLYPLFFQLAEQENAEATVSLIKDKLLKPGGIVSTPYASGQQWDAPNGWAPLQWIAIQGLKNYGYHDLAKIIAERWISLNTKVYKNTGKMMEKYNVENIDLLSGGGEYPVQDGFGWSNGVLLQLIDLYA